MKTIVAITLIVVGAVLIAAPVAAIVIESSTYQSNLVAYFERHGRGSAYDNPPNALVTARPTTAYFWFSGLLGVGLVAIGIRGSREPSSSTTA